MHGVTISELIEKMKLKNTTPEIDTDKIVLTHPDVNRPALQLTGFFDHFDRERVQIIGYVEQAYINTMDQEQKRRMYDKLMYILWYWLIFLEEHRVVTTSLCLRT